MDSYVFRAKGGELGYFQKDGDSGLLYIKRKFSPIYEPIDFKRRQAIDSILNPDLKGDDDYLIRRIVVDYLEQHCETISHHLEEFHKITSSSEGEYYPRMAFDNCNLYNYLTESDSFTDEVRAYYNIVDMLDELFKVIEPTQKNLSSYGHKIREILILACTEVEYLLKQILMDNGRKPQRSFYTTFDYVKALKPLKLNEYVIKLKMHPSLDSLSPFKGWVDKKGQTTKSLPWYDAYNSVKHDRGGNFESASLEAVINAVGAIHILLEAQYGKEIFHKFHLDFKSCFQTEEYPIWNVIDLQVPIIKIDWPSNELVWDKPIKYFKEGA